MGKSRAKIFQIIFVLVTTGAALVWPQPSPLCRLGVISTPYLTSQTIEELGPKRNFLVRTGPAGLAEAFRLAKEEKLSSLIILGDLTWTGSEADFEKLKGLLEKAPVPVILVPGPRDLSGGQERFLKAFARYAASVRFSRQVNGVRLIFNGLPVEKVEEQTAFLDWLDKESTLAESPEAVLLFGQLGSFLRQPAGHQLELLQRFRLRCQENRVAAALTPGHSHTCELVSNLPVWSAPTAGWPGEGNALGIVTVFPERIELSLCRSQQPWQTLTVPNPVKTARFDPGKDPYLLPPYSQDLAEKPELTFVLSGDPQFDDLTVERHKSRFSAVVTMNRALVEELNRLKPELVFVAGDLTNKHTPAEWQLFQETYRQLKMPVYLVAGNHDRLPPKDFWGTGKLKDLEETEKQTWSFLESTIKSCSGPLTLFQYFTRDFPSAGKPYYTVEKAGCVFICLDSSAMDEENGGLGSQQLAWLEKELERTKNARHVFVISHYPVHEPFGNTGLPAYQAEREKVRVLLKQYQVAGFLCGHRHFSASALVDATFHLVADDLCWGESTSYWIVHVFPDRIVYAWKPFQSPRHGVNTLYERIIVPEPRRKD